MCGEYDNLREGSLYSFRNYLTLNARYLITSAPASRGSDPVPKEYAILYHFLDSKTNLILYIAYPPKPDPFSRGL